MVILYSRFFLSFFHFFHETYYHLVFKVSGVDIWRTVYRKYCSCDKQATIQRLDNVVVRSQRRSTYSNVVLTLMPQRQNYNVAPAMPRRWIKSSTQNTLWMLYWQRYYKYYDVAPTSHQLYKKWQIWTIHGRMLVISVLLRSYKEDW